MLHSSSGNDNLDDIKEDDNIKGCLG